MPGLFVVDQIEFTIELGIKRVGNAQHDCVRNPGSQEMVFPDATTTWICPDAEMQSLLFR